MGLSVFVSASLSFSFIIFLPRTSITHWFFPDSFPSLGDACGICTIIYFMFTTFWDRNNCLVLTARLGSFVVLPLSGFVSVSSPVAFFKVKMRKTDSGNTVYNRTILFLDLADPMEYFPSRNEYFWNGLREWS